MPAYTYVRILSHTNFMIMCTYVNISMCFNLTYIIYL